jgi:hypothetical protein
MYLFRRELLEDQARTEQAKTEGQKIDPEKFLKIRRPKKQKPTNRRQYTMVEIYC